MLHTGIPTKLRCLKYGVKKRGEFYMVKRPYGILYHTRADELINMIYEEHQYDALNVYGKQVVDIGADCGDSALQFFCNGALIVYAYEPNLNSFKALEMTSVKSIKPYNMAVLGKAQEIGINPEAKANRGGKIIEGSYKIKATTLNDIVKEHNIIDGALKMDCEGYEYEIIDNSSAGAIMAFREIAIELHNGEGNIVERLTHLGYEITKTKPKKDGVFLIFAKRL
jgi:FkbM family methyltransferase